MELFDYWYFDICVNKYSVWFNVDGGVMVIVVVMWLGSVNWFDIVGYCIGMICWCWVGVV